MIQLFEKAKCVPGAISMTEAYALFDTITKNLSGKTPEAHALDLGSHAGKSSCVAAAALAFLGRAEIFHMVDPVYDLNNEQAWKQTVQGSASRMPWSYCNNVVFKDEVLDLVHSVSGNVPFLHGLSSVDFFRTYPNEKYSYVFIDSDDHQPELVLTEVNILQDRVLPGGLVFFHDFKNQYHGPAMAHEWLVRTGKYESIDIDWSTAKSIVNEYRLEVGNNSWHMPGVDNPNFLGVVRRL